MVKTPRNTGKDARAGMREIIHSLPDQLSRAVNFVDRTARPRRRAHGVVVCGMGGSGISGEILSVIYPQAGVRSNRDYDMAGPVGKDMLAILISYSGNTEETLANYRVLARLKVPMATVTSGGRLQQQRALFRVNVPAGLPPRGALGYLYGSLPVILHRFGLVKGDPVPGMIKLADFLKREAYDLDRAGEKIASRLTGKFIIIYANSAAFGVVANRWRCQLNENAKVMCHTNVIPEMNHNEIVGFGRPSGLRKGSAVILLNDPAAHKRNKLRTEILKEVIQRETGGILEIEPQGKDLAQRVFWTIMLGDFLSFHLAVKTGIDPMPVKRIDYLKKRLAAE